MPNQLAYDTDVSAHVQDDIGGIVGRLETVMDDRSSAVAAAMSNFVATGVSDDYAGVEQRWNSAAAQVKAIIALVKQTLRLNDGTATAALAKAKGIVQAV